MMQVTQHSNSSINWGEVACNDDALTLGAGVTIKEGTILARAATGKLIPHVKGWADGAGVPVAIAMHEIKSVLAGDYGVRAGISGQVRKNNLVIHADGTAAKIDGAVVDALRSYGIVAFTVNSTNKPDNQ